MGLISWIKNKYYNRKFQKAQDYLAKEDSEGAIEILKEIIDVHPSAPLELLSIFHSLISKNNSSYYIKEVASLYAKYPSLKDNCISFSKTLAKTANLSIRISYASSLYEKGAKELENEFVTIAAKYILENTSISSLSELTHNSSLLISLSGCILNHIKDLYRNTNNDLIECNRLSKMIYQYLSSKDYYNLYANIRFDILADSEMSDFVIKELDDLFNDVKTKYKLNQEEINVLTDKGLLLAKSLFNSSRYTDSLLVSQRLVDKYDKAKSFYSDSALNLYRNKNSTLSKVIDDILYKSLGESGIGFIAALEPFIPYAHHKNKYIQAVSDELTCLSKQQQAGDSLIQLLNHAKELVPEMCFIRASMETASEELKKNISEFILQNSNTYLESKDSLRAFVAELLRINEIEFVVATLESLIQLDKDVKNEYVIQVLKLARHARANSRKRIDIINRGLTVYEIESFIDHKTEYCKNYIESGRFDVNFATTEASSLIGKHSLAEVFLAKVYLYKASSSTSNVEKEIILRKAIEIKTLHNPLFDVKCYNDVLPEINSAIIDLVKDFHQQNKDKEAVNLLYLLRDNNLDWFDTYAKIQLDNLLKEDDISAASETIYNVLTEGQNIKSKIKKTLWEKAVELELATAATFPIDNRIQTLNHFLEKLTQICDSDNKDSLQKNVLKKLYTDYFTRGKSIEKLGDFNKAINDYQQILDLSEEYTDVKSRIFICKLKGNMQISSKDKKEIHNLLGKANQKPYQKDLAYRWCLHLLKIGSISEVEEINSRLLDSDGQLIELCNEEKIQQQQSVLDQLNEEFNKLNKGELSAEDAIALGQSFTKVLQSISFIAKLSENRISDIKETIRIFAISQFYKQENFVQCQKGLHIQEAEYLSNPLVLRNIAIACLRAAESGQLNKKNYKEFLAIWATAIYQQKLFVQSLEYTSWDNPFTFSLSDALGQLDNSDDELPDNINYSANFTDNLVAIKDVQEILITRMEVAVSDNQIHHQFFVEQLKAMDKLAEQNLDEPCYLVAPYLLNLSSTYRANVHHALQVEANGHYHNWETILEIGNLYGLSVGDFGRYATALSLLTLMAESIGQMKRINAVFTQSRVDSIREFESLNFSLISAVTTSLNKVIADEALYSRVLSDYGTIVKMIGDDSLTFIFSNYINQKVVKELNEKTLTLGKGASILFEIYEYSKCNPHLKRNISNIVEALIHNYISDGDADNLLALDNLLTFTREFDNDVVNSLPGGGDAPEEIMLFLFASKESRFSALKNRIGNKSPSIGAKFNITMDKLSGMKVQLELSQIVDMVNNNSMLKCDALKNVYNIYRSHQNNDRVCKNLVTLIPMCVIEYVIPNKVGANKVTSVLDSLKLNMSSTFRSNSSEIRQAHDMLWNQLPYDAQMTLRGISIGTSLNENGIALKKGLDYLKALS